MRVVAMILAGGAGTRLGVLSDVRAKPAVPFAGKFRIIDFPLSNCVNSGIYDVAVLTQYQPRSLNEHIGIGKPWDLDRARGGVRLLQPYQGREGHQWYAGTADAVLHNLDYIEEHRADTVVILSGDHIYKMDYRPMLQHHEAHAAELTLAVMNVRPEETSRFGILETDETGRVVKFLEKPQEAPSTLANMGVYVFDAHSLVARLRALSKGHADLDFGKHVIPSMIDDGGVHTFAFNDYWVDVGTIDAYWQTNLALLSGQSPLDLYDPSWIIHTRSLERPPVKVGPQAVIQESMVCNGAIVRGQVVRSVLSSGCYVSPGAVVRESVCMNDTWIGPGAIVDRCILDKNVVVGAGTQLGWGDDFDTPNSASPDRFYTGITLAGIAARIPANQRVGRNVVIHSDVDEETFASFGGVVPSGSTVG
jgi:glucose-1-phosphate adenylyltransferase